LKMFGFVVGEKLIKFSQFQKKIFSRNGLTIPPQSY